MFVCRIFIVALLTVLSACNTTRSTDLTDDRHPSGWAVEIRQAAARAYPYAQMSTNAYQRKDRFHLGALIEPLVDMPNDRKGFAYSVFRRRDAAGAPREIIIAYRGTEFSHLNDWFFGNLLGAQNRRGLQLFKDTQEHGLPITVTGHSLGGGIATHVSLRMPGADAYVFNSSPRFSRNGAPEENRRLSIVEYGEVLKVPRIFGREATQTYVSLNCTRGFNFMKGHDMRRLAECLTQIAAWGNMDARASLRDNNIRFPIGLSFGDPLLP